MLLTATIQAREAIQEPPPEKPLPTPAEIAARKAESRKWLADRWANEPDLWVPNLWTPEGPPEPALALPPPLPAIAEIGGPACSPCQNQAAHERLGLLPIWWKSHAGQWYCWACQPPPSLALVAEALQVWPQGGIASALKRDALQNVVDNFRKSLFNS